MDCNERKQALGEIPVVEREEERAAEGKLPRPPKKGGKPPLRNAAKQKFFGDRPAERIDNQRSPRRLPADASECACAIPVQPVRHRKAASVEQQHEKQIEAECSRKIAPRKRPLIPHAAFTALPVPSEYREEQAALVGRIKAERCLAEREQL